MTETVVQHKPIFLSTLEIEIRNERNYVVLALRGEADYATAPLLSRALSGTVEGSGNHTSDARACDVVIDLADLEFIDCRCIRIIVEARRNLREQRRGLRLRSPSTLLQRVLKILDLESLLESQATRASDTRSRRVTHPSRDRAVAESGLARGSALSDASVDSEMEHPDNRVSELHNCESTGDHYVVDFYRSLGAPFFGAVASRSRRSTLSDLDRRTDARSRPTVVTMVGELDVSTAPILHTCFEHLDDDLVVDCSGLDQVDARGLQILRDARARWARIPAEFVLVDPPDSLLWLFGVAGLDSNVKARARGKPDWSKADVPDDVPPDNS